MVKLKYDKNISSVIRQIKDRKYTQALVGYTGEILLVGINYDKGKPNKPHSCTVEKVEKNT